MRYLPAPLLQTQSTCSPQRKLGLEKNPPIVQNNVKGVVPFQFGTKRKPQKAPLGIHKYKPAFTGARVYLWDLETPKMRGKQYQEKWASAGNAPGMPGRDSEG